MPTVEEMQAVKSRVEQLQRQLGEIDGREKRLAQELATLGFKTLKDASAALPAERSKLAQLRKQKDDLLAKFNRTYTQYLEQGQGRA